MILYPLLRIFLKQKLALAPPKEAGVAVAPRKLSEAVYFTPK